MDKKDKILILIAPIAALTAGYMFFGDQIFPNEAPTAAQADFTSIEAPVTEARKNRTEIYRDKFEKENADKFKRKIETDDLFFGEEIKRDTAGNAPPFDTEDEQVTPTPDVTTDLVEQKPTGKRKNPTKPQIIVKSVERPDSTQTSSNAVTQQEPKRIRRAGFVSETSKTPAAVMPESGPLEEINIPVVIQENIDAKAGSNIQLRTLEESKINGVTIPKNTLVTGVVSFTQERVNVLVSSIKGSGRTVVIKLNGYDLDGNEGMPVEGGVNKEIKKDVVGSAIAEAGKVVNVPILNRLPINAGTKKINDPVIPLPKGYKLFLKQQQK
jgi:hypothetical protein